MAHDHETSTRTAVALGSVQETLLIPLYGRAVETKKKRPLLADPKAVEMVDSIDYDFTRFDGARSLFGSVLRTAIYDEWVRGFLAEHPAGTVVEIGTGLNTRFERLDNHEARWFELDLPDAITLRRKFFEDGARRTMLAESVLGDGWRLAVQKSPPPYFFVAEAVLIYLEPAQVRQAIGAIAREFPGSRLAFDTVGGWMASHQDSHDVLKKMAARMHWSCDDPHELEAWGLGLRLVESRTLANPPPALAPRVPWFLRTFGPIVFRKQVNSLRINLFDVPIRAAQ
jgi:O-methyltransferase involved in polyketide biosynthesis